MLRKWLFAWMAMLMAFVPFAVQAAQVTPMIIEVEPVGRASIARVELSNPGQNEFPVEAQMFRGIISETGELELTPADEDFLVFPPQRVVPARSQQVFRVQYVGDPDLRQSEMYYMQIRQIPLEFTPSESRVQVVINFNVLINVIPDGVSPSPKVEAVRPVVRDAVHGIEVRLSNEGTRYFTAGFLPWKISGTAEDGTAVEREMSAEEAGQAMGAGVVAPGRTRVFFIPTEKPLMADTIRAMPVL